MPPARYITLVLGATLLLTSTAEAARVNVIVIGAADYDDSNWNGTNTDLPGAIKQSCSDLVKLFEERVGVGLYARTFCSKRDTTIDTLRAFFIDEFPGIASGNITAVFWMGHGKAAGGGGTARDLLLAGSSTPKDGPNSKFLSVRSEIISRMTEELSPGSLVYFFIDSCSSGSVKSPQLESMVAGHGIKLLVTASSPPDVPSYNAAYTRGLISSLRKLRSTQAQGPCSNIDDLNRDAEDYMKLNILGPKTWDASPRVIVRYNGPVCLSAFGKADRLIAVFNPTDKAIKVTVTRLGPQQKKMWDRKTAVDPFEPFPLPAGKYNVVIDREDSVQLPYLNLDLTEERNKFKILTADSAPTLGQLGHQGELLSNWIFDLTGDAEAAVKASKLAMAAYTEASDEKNAQRVRTVVLERYPEASRLLSVSGGIEMEAESTFEALVAQGQYMGAADTMQKAAQQTKDKGISIDYLTKAYYALTLAEEDTAAKKLRWATNVPVHVLGDQIRAGTKTNKGFAVSPELEKSQRLLSAFDVGVTWDGTSPRRTGWPVSPQTQMVLYTGKSTASNKLVEGWKCSRVDDNLVCAANATRANSLADSIAKIGDGVELPPQ